MKKALIIGGAGFVGKHLAEHIFNVYGWDLHITKMKQEEFVIPYGNIYDVDILDMEQLSSLLNHIKPDFIFHLAAQSSVALSWKNPQLTVDVNIKGSLNLLEALRNIDTKPRTLLIGSSEEYGHIKQGDFRISEDYYLRPGNIYAVTKVCQNMLGKIYADAYGLDIIGIRAFNHIGPGQAEGFVAADFCKQIAEIEAGMKEPVIVVGNLSAKRDFTDVRDVVRAYTELMKYGQKGETYNIGSGSAVEIQTILNMIISLSTVRIDVKTDSEKIRPVDIAIIEADISKIANCTGWRPEINLEDTIKNTLDYWRTEVKKRKN